MKPDPSLPCSQQLSSKWILSHISPVRTSKIHFSTDFPHTSRSFYLSISFRLSHRVRSFSPACVLHILAISSSLTSITLFSAKGTSYEAPHNTTFSNLELLNFSSVQIVFPAPCSEILFAHNLPLLSETNFRTNTKLQEKLIRTF
jgi:hypothetical protein